MRCWPRISGSARLGAASCARPGWRAAWTSCAPAPSSTWSSARTPAPAPRRPPAATGHDGAAGAGPAPDTGPAGGAAGGFAGRVTLTVPLGTAAGRADRPGELSGLGRPGRPLAGPRPPPRRRAEPGHDLVRHGDRRARATPSGTAAPGPNPKATANAQAPVRRTEPGFTFTPASRDGPPGGYGTWRLRVPGGGPDLIVAIDTLDTHDCEHRYEARGHDPGVRLRHLSQVRHATCTSPVCRRPARTCDFEHNMPYEAGGRTCLCNGGPKCRHDHRLKQQPGWKVDQLPDGTFRWTTPAGRSYDTEPTRYPI